MTLSTKDRAAYPGSLINAIVGISKGTAPTGLAAELSREYAIRDKADSPHLRVPLDLILESRALTTNVFSAAGSFVGAQVGAVDPLPRSASVCLRAGARLLTGIKGGLSIPRQTGAETISFVHETDTINPTDSAFGTLNLSGHRLSGAATISQQLATQTDGIAAQTVIESLGLGVAHAIDRGALVGIGAAGDVLGLHYASGVNTKTFGGAATQLILTDMKSTVLGNNADRDFTAWICHPDVEEKWSNLYVNGTGSAKSLWDIDRNTVAGLPAFTTTAAPATGALVGDFSRLVIAFFGESVEVIVDPYSQSLAGRISFVINALADTGHLRPEMVVRNSDTVVA
jgi:HK97 family phage major capsid protein